MSALLIMAKRPSPGKTKTRLCPPLTEEQAAELYACFLQDIISLARSLPDVTPFIAYSPPSQRIYFANLVPDFHLIAQEGATLGDRLDHILSGALGQGFERVIALNSDSPSLPAAYVAQAFEALKDTAVDVTLGPAEDGGYYLIGWKRPHPRLVREVQMSTPTVLADTLAIAQADGLRVRLTPPWYDVDTAAELARLENDLNPKSSTYQFLQNLN